MKYVFSTIFLFGNVFNLKKNFEFDTFLITFDQTIAHHVSELSMVSNNYSNNTSSGKEVSSYSRLWRFSDVRQIMLRCFILISLVAVILPTSVHSKSPLTYHGLQSKLYTFNANQNFLLPARMLSGIESSRPLGRQKDLLETGSKREKTVHSSVQITRKEDIGTTNQQYFTEKDKTGREVRLKRGEVIQTTTSSAIMNSNNNNHPQQQQQQDPSCYRSPILQNVTLRGGIQAGYFRKLAEHVAMKLCVELCCEEKGCDVAFMWGKHCYGVQCFSRDLCEAVPAKRDVTESIMLSHVTFQGERCK